MGMVFPKDVHPILSYCVRAFARQSTAGWGRTMSLGLAGCLYHIKDTVHAAMRGRGWATTSYNVCL